MTLCSGLVAEVPFFGSADRSFLAQLLPLFHVVHFLHDDIIIRQGSAGKEMYFIESGTVEVIVNDVSVAILNPGQFFGEIAVLFENMRRTATIKAIGNCILYRLDVADLEKVLEINPKMAASIQRIAEKRLDGNLYVGKNYEIKLENNNLSRNAKKKLKQRTDMLIAGLPTKLDKYVLKIDENLKAHSSDGLADEEDDFNDEQLFTRKTSKAGDKLRLADLQAVHQFVGAARRKSEIVGFPDLSSVQNTVIDKTQEIPNLQNMEVKKLNTRSDKAGTERELQPLLNVNAIDASSSKEEKFFLPQPKNTETAIPKIVIYSTSPIKDNQDVINLTSDGAEIGDVLDNGNDMIRTESQYSRKSQNSKRSQNSRQDGIHRSSKFGKIKTTVAPTDVFEKLPFSEKVSRLWTKFKPSLTYCPIHPSSDIAKMWNSIMEICFGVVMILLPVSLSLSKDEGMLEGVSIFVTVVLFLDFIIRLQTGFKLEDEIEMEPLKIVWICLRNGRFAFDLVSGIPWVFLIDALTESGTDKRRFYRLICLVHGLPVIRLFLSSRPSYVSERIALFIRNYNIHHSATQGLKILVVMLSYWHWQACAIMFLILTKSIPYYNAGNTTYTDFDNYILNFWSGVTEMLNTGCGVNTPRVSLDRWFRKNHMIINITLQAFFAGNISAFMIGLDR